ncbi:unnamed protein product [Parnassius mnemosyne]|uniref:Uncharacterized protein n=1 Tax=Parnassius mnemosyne TaxID=213953 RepID=A0AAV1M0X5_9NEOP
MEKQPAEPDDFTNEPLPSMSKPMEVQDAVASTLATPFAQPIISASKSKAQKQREESKNVLRQYAQQQSTTTADQPDKRVNLTNEPLFPAIPVPMEVQEAVASTSATPFAKPITAAPKTRAQIQREYRQRIAASRTLAQAAAAREARNVRDRNNRLCQAANLGIASGSLEATTTSSSRSGQRLNTVHIDTQRQFTDQQRQTLATEPAETTVQPSTSSDQIEVQAQSTWNTPI